jgi:ferrous iron transport protein A
MLDFLREPIEFEYRFHLAILSTAEQHTMTLAEILLGQTVRVESVGGERAFRRRLLELGLVPGTRVQLVSVAPLGDPLELLVRGYSLSIRRAEASSVSVAAIEDAPRSEQLPQPAVDLADADCARGAP